MLLRKSTISNIANLGKVKKLWEMKSAVKEADLGKVGRLLKSFFPKDRKESPT